MTNYLSSTAMPGNASRQRLGPWQSWVVLSLLSILLLSTLMLPTSWSGNEINYFDLSYAYFYHEGITPKHAVYDTSNARFFSFLLIGGLIDILGFDGAKILLSFLMMAGLGMGFAALALSLGLGYAEALVVLIFVMLNPSLLGGEWIFGGIEAKTLAYCAVLPALSLAWRDRRVASVLLLVLATYCHFLVGGFWTLAVLVLWLLRPARSRVALMLGFYIVLVVPQLYALLSERVGGVQVDTTGLGHSVAQIYAALRNPHHLVPFLSMGGFGTKWMPGTLVHAALAVLFGLAGRRAGPGSLRTLAMWLCLLNAYIPLAIMISFIDRHDYRFAPLYMFRPAALILMLSGIGGIVVLRAWIGNAMRLLTRVVLVLSVASILPFFAMRAKSFAEAPSLSMMGLLDPGSQALVNWAQTNTAPGDVVLIEPRGGVQEGEMPSGGFERLMQRPTLINWKFVPTLSPEIARWYDLIQWRDKVFEGNCGLLSEQPVSWLILLQPIEKAPAAACGQLVWQNESYAALKVVR